MNSEIYRTSLRETEELVDRPMRVLLCHSNPRDQELLADRLDAPDRTIVVPDSPESLPQFDLCVADVNAFNRIAGEIATRRRELDPVHVPVLLILGPRDSEARVGPSLDQVDDVVEVPTSAEVLTRRVEALLQIRRQSEQLALFGRAMDDAATGISIADADGDQPLRYVNDAFVEMTGYDRDAVLGRNCRFLQGPATDPEPVRKMRRAIDNEEPVTVELRNYRKDGSLFWNHVEIAPVHGEHGVTHYVGFQQDITERVEQTQELQRYEEIVTAAGDPIYALDSELRFTLVNEATTAFSAQSEAKLLGANVETVFGPDHAAALGEAVLYLAESGEDETTIDTAAPDTDGRKRQFQTTVAVLPTDEFEVVCVSRDVTEDRERQSRLSVLDRVLRHNLRNKLMVMLAQVEQIAARSDDDAITDSTRAIERAGEELLELANTAREFDRTTDPADDDAVGPVNVAIQASNAVEETRVEYGDATVEADVPASLWAIAHDSFELAMGELLERAATAGEDVTVVVEMDVDSETGDVVISVSHDGTGLDDVEYEALNAGIESDLQHTQGLGLWFVRWMAINSGGSFSIADADPGTRVELTLPLADTPPGVTTRAQ